MLGERGDMATYNLIATATFGVESIVAEELKSLGYPDARTENGRVSFSGDDERHSEGEHRLEDCADRVLIKMASFKAIDFEALFQGTLAVRWEDFIPADGKMHVVGKSHKSLLSSVPDCQSIVKKAIVEAMKRRYHRAQFEESGPVYRIEVALLSDIATLTSIRPAPGSTRGDTGSTRAKPP